MTYLIYIHAENEYKQMRDLPASTGCATDSLLRRRGHSVQNYFFVRGSCVPARAVGSAGRTVRPVFEKI
jgi:hypothetical protein